MAVNVELVGNLKYIVQKKNKRMAQSCRLKISVNKLQLQYIKRPKLAFISSVDAIRC